MSVDLKKINELLKSVKAGGSETQQELTDAEKEAAKAEERQKAINKMKD